MARVAITASTARGAAVVASLVLLSACSSDELPTAALPEQPALNMSGGATPEFVPGQVIVKFKAGTAASAREAALQAASARVGERILTAAMRSAGDREGLTVVHSGLGTMAAIGRLRGNPNVEYAEPNWIYQHHATLNDPYFTNGSLWGMYGDATSPANAFGSQAGEAWAANHVGSHSIVVGVIDEGIQVDHPDLKENIWVNPFDPVDGIDNDENGYVDDVYGWDFDRNDNTVYDGGNRGSVDKHGTHVAGTIGARANASGVVGVNWEVTMISAKFLGRRGGTTANAIKAVDYLTDLKTRHLIDLVASNNSWGGGGFSQALYDAIQRANTANILFIAAAGNGGSDGVGDDNDVTPHYPSSYDNANIIAVASITSSGAKSSFSNYGANSVDIGAPGSGINSTLPYNTYGSYSGTSMATPHVTGGAALRAAHGTERGATLKNLILNSAVSTPTPSLSGKVVSNGRLNVSGF